LFITVWQFLSLLRAKEFFLQDKEYEDYNYLLHLQGIKSQNMQNC